MESCCNVLPESTVSTSSTGPTSLDIKLQAHDIALIETTNDSSNCSYNFATNCDYEDIDDDGEEINVAMKLADSISDLNPEILFDSGLVHLACNETVQSSQLTNSESSVRELPSIVLVPLSSLPSSNISPADVLKQCVSRTGETVFREDLVSIFVYIVRNLRFSRNANLHFIIDARQLSTDDQKAALDIILGSVYSAFLAFPDNISEVKLLSFDSIDWLNELVKSFKKRNPRFSTKLDVVSPPSPVESLFDTDAQAKCRKYFTQWLDYRQLVEQLNSLTEHVSRELDSLISSLSRELTTPINVDGVDKQIEEHQRALKEVFKGDEFLEFQETAESDLQQLNDIAASLSNQLPDCVNFYRSLQNRHKAIQEQLTKVVCMSKMRLNSRLELKQILRLTSEVSREISWLNTEATSTLEKMEGPVKSSQQAEKVANQLNEFGLTLMEHLNNVTIILGRVRESVAFNSHADKKLSPLADLLRVAADSTRDRIARIERKCALNVELIGKIDNVLTWCSEIFSFLSSLELPSTDLCQISSSNSQPLHLLVQSASRLAQFKTDHPDPIKNAEEGFGRLDSVASELGCIELSSMLLETKSKHAEAVQMFHSKEERLDAALKQLLKLGNTSVKMLDGTEDSSPTHMPRTTIAQMRLQRRILRSVSLLEQSGDSESCSEDCSSECKSGVESSPCSSSTTENCGGILRPSRANQAQFGSSSNKDNRRSVAVLKALDEINEHLLDFERSACDTCSTSSPPGTTIGHQSFDHDVFLPYSPIGSAPIRRNAGDSIMNQSTPQLPIATDPVVMRRRPSVTGYSSSSSTGSCSTCRMAHNQSSISPSHCSSHHNHSATNNVHPTVSHQKRFSLYQQSKSVSTIQQPLIIGGIAMGNAQVNNCLMPMSAKDEQIVAELLQTECDYIASLRYVIDNYLVPLTQDFRPHPLQGKLNIVFGNIESLLEFHETLLLPELDLCRHNLFLFATCFLRAEQELSSLYIYYNTNKSRSDRLLSENAALFSSIQNRLGHKLDVASYLLKPVQRLAKYSQFLRQLICGRSPNDVAHGQLMLAERLLSYILRHGNDLLLLEQLRGYDFALAEQGQLLRQDELFVERKGKTRKLRHLFLFEEILVISKIHKLNGRGNFYEYKESVKICDIGLTPLVGRSGTKFEVWFRRPNSGFRYVIKAETPALRLAWTTDIEELLWRQAVAVKERRAAQFVSMGIGLRGLISLQPSSNNISSRTVNYASPNSISSTSSDGEKIREGGLTRRPASVMVLTAAERQVTRVPPLYHANKRPYSWLSSASSGTTQSSFGANSAAANATTTNDITATTEVSETNDNITSPLITTPSTERLLIPKLITTKDGKEAFVDIQGQVLPTHLASADPISSVKTCEMSTALDAELDQVSNAKITSEPDETISSEDMETELPHRIAFSKPDDDFAFGIAGYEIVHCTPCTVK